MTIFCLDMPTSKNRRVTCSAGPYQMSPKSARITQGFGAIPLFRFPWQGNDRFLPFRRDVAVKPRAFKTIP
jgi:hypothetical protein